MVPCTVTAGPKTVLMDDGPVAASRHCCSGSSAIAYHKTIDIRKAGVYQSAPVQVDSAAYRTVEIPFKFIVTGTDGRSVFELSEMQACSHRTWGHEASRESE
jgi:hypothetical protein